MPTENRSSNTEMVSVPREPSAQMLDAARNAPVPMVYVDSMRARQDLEFSARYKAAISQCTQLAPTTHPDPIAWMVGTAFWWTKEEAERDAADTGLPIVGLGPMAGVSPAEQHQGEPVAWRYLESDAESGAYYKPEYSENRWHEIPEKLQSLHSISTPTLPNLSSCAVSVTPYAASNALEELSGMMRLSGCAPS